MYNKDCDVRRMPRFYNFLGRTVNLLMTCSRVFLARVHAGAGLYCGDGPAVSSWLAD